MNSFPAFKPQSHSRSLSTTVICLSIVAIVAVAFSAYLRTQQWHQAQEKFTLNGTQISSEAIQNLASIYNTNHLIVNDLTVAGST